jgi:hypothetical protein
LEHSILRCWNLVTSESRSEIPEKFWNVVLKMEEEDQFDQSCKKEELLHRVKEEWSTLCTIKRRKANWFGHILHRKSILNQITEGKIEERTK